MEKENMVKCQNCEVDILEYKYPLHESYCLRNIKKCECGDIVNLVDYEDHFNEKHKIVECNHCNLKMENKELTSHLDKCNEKPKSCKYCNLEVSNDSLADHEYICGSKTEQCSNCLKYVQIKDYDNHVMHGCDPGIKLNNHFNVDKLPFINKKSKNKISAVARLINSYGKKEVKIDSPFSDNFNIESINQHPVIFNSSISLEKNDKKQIKFVNEIKNNINENSDINVKQKEIKDLNTKSDFSINIVEKNPQFNKKGQNNKKEKENKHSKNSNTKTLEFPENNKISDNNIKELKENQTNINENLNKNMGEVDIEAKYGTKEVIIKRLPYQKKIIEETKEEPKEKEDKKKKKKKKNKSDFVVDEDDNLAYDNNDCKKKKMRKISDRSEKYTKKKLSHNDLEDADFGEVLNTVEKNFYVNPRTQEEEILRRVLEKSKLEK